MGALDGKVALVGGASRGIGKGIAVELGLAGAHVVAVGRTRQAGAAAIGSLEETAQEIEEAGGSVTVAPCDLTDETSVSRLLDEVRSAHASLDVVVNSAFNSYAFGPSIGVRFWDLPLHAWREVVDVGTKSAYLTTAASAPLLMDGGGLVVNISGRGAERYRYNVAYGVGKAALDRMTRDMAADLQEHAVAVVSLWPNVTRTETIDLDRAQAEASYGDLDRLETPRYIGRGVVALAADPSVMQRTGNRYWVAELGRDYGFVDENGRDHPLPE